jgi:hypothetical protein
VWHLRCEAAIVLTTADHEDLVRRAYEVFNARDIDAAAPSARG